MTLPLNRLAPQLLLIVLAGCEEQRPAPHHDAPRIETKVAPVSVKVDAAQLGLFAALPASAPSKANPGTKEKVELGRLLWFDARLSKHHDLSCNSCHDLAHAGVDGKDFSLGDPGKPLTRNTPSIENAALAFVQFADGRAETVEDAVKAVLEDPAMMGAPGEARLVETCRSMPAYEEAFKRAFPEDADPITLANTAHALSSFVRTLLTPSKWDRFIAGDKAALTDEEKKGFSKFADSGCPQCHVGPLVGGTMYQKLGKEKPWPDAKDKGRSAVTKSVSDDMMFAVPSLRNVRQTAPYFHDASVKTLDEAVKKMSEFQLGKQLGDADAAAIVAWLGTLDGALAAPETPPSLPASTPKTPKPSKK